MTKIEFSQLFTNQHSSSPRLAIPFGTKDDSIGFALVLTILQAGVSFAEPLNQLQADLNNLKQSVNELFPQGTCYKSAQI